MYSSSSSPLRFKDATAHQLAIATSLLRHRTRYNYLSSVVNIRKNIPKNNNLAKLLKAVNNKLTVFEVTEIDQDIVESTMLDNQKFIDSIDECKVVVIILNEPL